MDQDDELFNPLKTSNPKIGTLANSEDPYEMPHNGGIPSSSALVTKPKSMFRERNIVR